MPIHDSRQQQQYNNNNKNNQANPSSTSSSLSSCRTSLNSATAKSDSVIKTTSGSTSTKSHKLTGSGDIQANKSDKTNRQVNSSNRQANDGSSASAMSNLSSDYYIDDDHIDDQETINVGNLIIDLESDLEKEKIENEQQANAKPTTCSTTTIKTSSSSSSSTTNAAPSSSSNHSSYSNTSSSATSSTANNPAFNSNIKGSKASSSTGSTGLSGGKSNQKSSSRSSVINSNNNNNNNLADNGNNAINSSNNNGHPASSRAVFKSSSDERGELKMRITRETMPGKSEHKIVTSPNQKSPTSSSNSSVAAGSGGILGVSSAYASSYDEAIMQKSPSSKPSQSSSISSTKECGTSTSIGTITEPECLGPCEPGTSVTLEGIVWQETDGGILVVNVTWRGKTYVGALLDCTKHDWAPPRLCDSPASDIDSKTSKGVRTKRIVTRSNGIGLDEKNLLQTTGKLRNGKGRRILAPSDLASCSKRQRDSEKLNDSATNQIEAGVASNVSSNSNSENLSSVPMNIETAPNDSISTSNITSDKAAPNSPMLIGCNEPNCSKKYRNMNGLLYHQAHAHVNENDSSNSAQENNCSSSIKPKDTSKEDQLEELTTPAQLESTPSPDANAPKEQEVQTPSTHSDTKLEHNTTDSTPRKEPALETVNPKNFPINQESRIPVAKGLDFDRRNAPSNPTHHLSDFGRKSPVSSRHSADYGPGPGPNPGPNLKQSSSGSSKQPVPAPMPPTTEEGMKPSGTSTGPPPAPHQANCFFNPAFLANNYNPYLSPYFPRMPLPPMYDGLNPATSSAYLSRFMSNVRPPPPPTSEPSSRLLSPSIPKNLPYPPFKMEPGLPMPPPQMPGLTNPVGLPAMSPMTHPPPLPGGSPHLRMPSQGDPMLPPTSQAPIPPPPSLNPLLGLPGPLNPMGPFGGPPSAKFGG